MNKTAVFISMMSIQRYIFASNNLKENIGASHIVKNSFEELKKNYNYSYIGGGNALLYFDSPDKAKKAMKEWSRLLLQKAAGLTPVITIEEQFNTQNYSQSRINLITKAKRQENKFIPQTSLGAFGITADCPRSGLSAEVWGRKLPKDEQAYISSVSHAKILASEEANEQLLETFDKSIGNYKFTNEINKLGGSKGENSHIAIIHIDGNDLGGKFKNMETEEEITTLSEGLKKAVQDAFEQTLQQLIDILPELKRNKEISLSDKILPIRPIVLGGDDVTFVCDARLALFLTQKFITAFEEQEICKANNISACGGISIVKTKYPFYRAYRMAEALCSGAKQKRKQDQSQESYIDFHISFGGLGGSPAEIRQTNYMSLDAKRLYKRPYSLKKDIPDLIRCIADISKLPQTKIKKLREVLYEGETATSEWIKELEYRNQKLPAFGHSDISKKGFSNEETPYIDMIELMDFYPNTFLQKEKNNE